MENVKHNWISYVILFFIVGLIVVGYFVWRDLKEENLKLQSEVIKYSELSETLVRSSNQWTTKDDLDKYLKGLLTKEELELLQKDLKKLDAKLISVGQTVGFIKGKVAKLEQSSGEGPDNPNVEHCDDGRLIDTHEYTKNIQIKELTNSQEAPIGVVEFDASSDAPWNYRIHDQEFFLNTAVGQKDNGQLVFYHNLSYSIPDMGFEKYPIAVLHSEFVQIKKDKKFFWINPTLDFMVFGGGKVYQSTWGLRNRNSIISMGFELGVSLSSYGKTEVDSSVKMFRLSLGYDVERANGRLAITPVLFNIGEPLPLLTNLYIGPQFGIDTSGGLTLTLGLGMQL